jgi:biopolymer transport protein TolQ
LPGNRTLVFSLLFDRIDNRCACLRKTPVFPDRRSSTCIVPARLEIADKISPAQMGAVNAAMERAVGETALSLESQMILLATAVSGSPFLGLLGTVWGVMDAFTGVAEAGSPNLVSMAPGVSGALITTVTALCVAIPAMFGYNFLVTSIRGMIVEMDNFAAELASEFEHKYVDHSVRESAFRR